MTKIVLQNFKKTPNCTCWPKELNQKSFQRNIQYRTRPKGPPFSFFGIARLFKNSFGCCRSEYFDTLKSFCYFWALYMAPTWAGPGLFSLRQSRMRWKFSTERIPGKRIQVMAKSPPFHFYFLNVAYKTGQDWRAVRLFFENFSMSPKALP